MFYVNGYNVSGYSPDPDHLHVFASLADAREDHSETLKRWAEDCYSVPTDREDEQVDLQEIAASLAGSAETVREWIGKHGGWSIERGPDGNEYIFWTEPKTLAELREDGWSDDDLEHILDSIASYYSEFGDWYCRTHRGELCGPYPSEAAMRADF